MKSDLPAAIVVVLVALPLCLGIALASGAPLISGVIAGILGGIVVGMLSHSPLGVAGPAAGLAIIVLNAIKELGAFDIFLAAVVLAGMLQLALGFARAGVIAYYFPSSVITGMLSGIGLVIFIKQIPHALGYDADPEGDFAFSQIDGETTFSEMGRSLSYVSTGALIIALTSLAILLLWETQHFKKHTLLSRIPAALVAVVVGVFLNMAFRSSPTLALSSSQLVSIPITNSLDDLRGMFTFPALAAFTMPAVYKTAVVMAIVASLETLLCAEATDKLDPLRRITPTNRELKAQGIGNIISGLVGGLPITQVIVRSSANVQAGGRTKAATVMHGLFLLLAVMVLPAVMNLIPLSTLAAILLVVGYKLAKPSLFMRLFLEGPAQFIPFLVTVAGIVFIDLLVGIGFGLAAAIVTILIENYQLPFQVQSSPRTQDSELRIVLAQQVTFLNKANILQSLNNIPPNTTVEIDALASIYVHADVVELIDDFVIGAKARNIAVNVKGLEHHQKGHPKQAIDISVTTYAAAPSAKVPS